MHDKLYSQFRKASNTVFFLCDSPPVIAFSSRFSVSGHFLCLLLTDLVMMCWQVENDVVPPELTTTKT